MLFLMHEETVPFQLKLSCSLIPLNRMKIPLSQELLQQKRWKSQGGNSGQLERNGIVTWCLMRTFCDPRPGRKAVQVSQWRTAPNRPTDGRSPWREAPIRLTQGKNNLIQPTDTDK